MRTNIYIDGFNLYYGSLKASNCKWLDLKKLSEKLLKSENKIQTIKLFTARVKPTDNDPTVHLRQEIYLKALQAHIPELEIIYGHFQQHGVPLPLADDEGTVLLSKKGKPKFVTVCKREEKGSDVNLAVHFLYDACQDKYDCGIIISNDSDLAEAMHLVKKHGKRVVGVVSPYPTVSKELSKHSHFQKVIRTHHLQDAQLPEIIPGTKLKKPNSW